MMYFIIDSLVNGILIFCAWLVAGFYVNPLHVLTSDNTNWW